MNSSNDINIAVFASGGGSNAFEIFKYFEKNDSIKVVLCVSNNSEAGVLNHADSFSIERCLFMNDDFMEGSAVLNKLEELKIDYIVLAGFLRKIPKVLTDSFKNKIINIHPALLPKYGGKGMYGLNVHRAVKENNESVSGPTIHLVNEKFDDGAILAQFETRIDNDDTPEEIAKKVLKLEHQYFSKVIETYINDSQRTTI